MEKRENNIDVFKGMAIFFVVLGHISNVPKDVFIYVYSFHVPLFFFCSGYLMYFTRERTMSFQYTKNLFKKVMIPFYLAYLISYFVTLIFESEKRTLSFFTSFVKGGLLGSHWMDVNNFPLWFLPLFFISVLTFKYLSTFSLKVITVIGAICFIISPYAYLLLKNPEENIVWSINVLFPAIFFMIFGFFMNHFKAMEWFNHQMSFFISMICGAAGLVIAFHFPSEILYIENHWYLIGAVLAIIFFIWLNKDNQNSIIRFLGKNSMIILVIHKIINFILIELGFDKFLTSLNLSGIIFAATFSIVIMFLSLLPVLIRTLITRKRTL
ncbi:acyltransferase family protein [Vagococcus carniphilus]|uniref:acyltransferase family protein n=1 Tax=Vagococcus carniphilus TaxID=218144 RepID=UPI0028925225|nr:acyltransferase family protein [Vagococcus carniphilus]MDT2814734.1 acyltransferase family protein [Vagococcus carniphilus]MDT2864867.1 acyltransferase family protein [Vagococcus carniphilus]